MRLITATAEINKQALSYNYQQLTKLNPNSKVLAILKANGYGHGIERIANALPQADALGVARFDEALALRAAGISKPIVLLEGFFSEAELQQLEQYQLQTVIHNQYQLDLLRSTPLSSPIKVWLKIDTGMNRLGIAPEKTPYFVEQLQQCRYVDNQLVLMSHLACADEPNNQQTQMQIQLFNNLSQAYNFSKSLANSAAVCSWPETHFDWLRPGLMLYGVSPMQQNTPLNIDLMPVMTLKSSLIEIKPIKSGEQVGYGANWTATEDTHLGVIAIGYGDGYPRHAKNGTPVLLNNRLVPLVGRVSMDMITVDLGRAPKDHIGDIAILWGNGLPIEQIAQCADTIPYELLCNITRRVHMRELS